MTATGISVRNSYSEPCIVPDMAGIGARVKRVRIERNLKLKDLARLTGLKYQTLQDLESGESKSSRYLLTIAKALLVDPNWLQTGEGSEQLKINAQMMRTPETVKLDDAPRDIPVSNVKSENLLKVVGMAEGGPGEWCIFNGDEVVQYITRPDNLAGVPNAYAVFIRGTSMVPRYEPGEIVHIHPGKPVQPGSYVLVQRRNPGDENHPYAVVKQLVRRSATKVTLAQLNPAKQFDVPAGEIVSIHRIVGASEA